MAGATPPHRVFKYDPIRRVMVDGNGKTLEERAKAYGVPQVQHSDVDDILKKCMWEVVDKFGLQTAQFIPEDRTPTICRRHISRLNRQYLAASKQLEQLFDARFDEFHAMWQKKRRARHSIKCKFSDQFEHLFIRAKFNELSQKAFEEECTLNQTLLDLHQETCLALETTRDNAWLVINRVEDTVAIN